jgi:hypothetical protein
VCSGCLNGAISSRLIYGNVAAPRVSPTNGADSVEVG